MLTEIEQHCQACAACVEYSAKPPRQHSLATPVPPAIAHTLGLDFALVHDKKKAPLKVLILTDYLSGWITYFKFTKPPAVEAIAPPFSPIWLAIGGLYGWRGRPYFPLLHYISQREWHFAPTLFSRMGSQ